MYVHMYVCMYHEMLKTWAFESETPDWANYLTSLSLSFLDHNLRQDNLGTVDSLRILHVGLL